MDAAVAILKSWASPSAIFNPATPDFLDDLEILAACSGPLPDPPPDLVARPCRLPAARWHIECLRQLLHETSRNSLRIALHAQWLLYALSGWDPVEAPLVSIIIPVYNRANMALEAVASCLRQTYLRYEIIVVDDGSDDHLDQQIRPYIEQGLLAYARKNNGGVSTARNLGVRLARGHYLHFLDSDNLLNPDSLDRWMAAFTAVPDAELCYAPSEILAGPGVTPGSGINPAPTGAPDCPTNNLMHCVVKKYPFLVGGVMLARWVAAEAGPFDETLRRHEDTLYWFKLALRETRVVGLCTPNNKRRINKENLSEASFEDRLPDYKQMRLISLTCLFQCPTKWFYTGHFIRNSLGENNTFDWEGYGNPLWFDALEQFLNSIRHLKENGDKHGLSSRPLLALFAHHVLNAKPNACREKANGTAARAVAEAVSAAWDESSPLSSHDVEVWFYPENWILNSVDFPALSLILQEIDERKASPCPVIHGLQRDRLSERVDAINREEQRIKQAQHKQVTGKVTQVNPLTKTFTVTSQGQSFVFSGAKHNKLPAVGETVSITYAGNPGGGPRETA